MEGMAFISCVRFSMQLMISESAYAMELERKKNFLLRFAVSLVCYFLAARLVFGLARQIPGNNPLVYTAYYTALFFLTLGVIRACFSAKGKDILFVGVCGYATEHIAFALVTIIQELTGVSFGVIADFIVIRFLPYVLLALFVYLFVLKKSEGERELKERDIRMIILSFVILLTTVFVSVLVDSRFFAEDSGLLRNVICRIYSVICCALSIFVAFSISRQNRVVHENEMMETMLHNMKEQQRLSRENINIISIQVKKKGPGSYIHMDNTCTVQPEFEDGLPVTTKEDKAYHGFGVRSIRYIVEKYKGDLLMQASDGRFSVDILFYR